MSRSRPTCITAGLVVCTGKDCRHSKGFAALVEMAGETARAHELPCQGVCKGPVVGLHVEGEMHWFSRIRSSSKRSLIAKMVGTAHVPKKLRDREARKRRGQVRGQHRMHPLDRRRAQELTK